jgi:uncharacterized protein YndB with AHSA1/START domain
MSETQTVTLERDYPAPPARLFEAWTDVGILRRWFGCGPGMLWTVHEWDVHPGGTIHVSLEFPHGTFHARGAFLVVEAPHRLSYSWQGDGMPEEQVEVRIAPHGSGSRMKVVHSKIPADRDPAIQTGGWTSAFDHLAGLDI